MLSFTQYKWWYGIIAILALMMACAQNPSAERRPADKAENTSEEQLYKQAQDYLDNKFYDLAIQVLQNLLLRFPYGAYSEQVQLELIYAYYLNSNREKAIEIAERFIRYYPNHADVDYVYYVKALSLYSEGQGLLSRIFRVNASQRNVTQLYQCFREFGELLEKFPDSIYVPDAHARMKRLRYLLAEHEMAVAEHYFVQKAYIATINRGNYVLEYFPGSPFIPAALDIMIRAYLKIGMTNLAVDTWRVFDKNYPQHKQHDTLAQLIRKARAAT